MQVAHLCGSLRRRSSYNSDAIFAYSLPLESSIQELQFKKKFDPSTTIHVPRIGHFVKLFHLGQKTLHKQGDFEP